MQSNMNITLDSKTSESLVRFKKYLDKVVSRDVYPADKDDFDIICEAADTDVSLSKLRELVAQGDLDAQYYLGVCYFYGVGIDTDKNKAVELFVSAAVFDNPAAQNHLAYCLQTGQGIQKNDKQAFEWLQKAASQSYWGAHNNLGFAYEHGIGVRKDEKKAFEHTKIAAEHGNGAAQNNLACQYLSGFGAQKDENEAYKWFQKSAAQNNYYGTNGLARCYRDGSGTQRDLQKALEFFHRSAKANNPYAQSDLGLMYHDGVGTEKDFKKAEEFYRKSANQNNDVGQWNLAYCYDRGEGVELSEAKAFVWKAKSANLGHQLAKKSLVHYYTNDEMKAENDLMSDNTKLISAQYPALTYHQQLAVQVPAVKGWALWGHHYLFAGGLAEAVLNYLIVSPHFEINNIQDYAVIRGYFLDCEFLKFKAELKDYAQSEHKSLSGYQARAQSFWDECQALTLSNQKHFNQWHESLQFIVSQFEAIDSKEAKNIPLHKAPLIPVRDNYYAICKRYLLFTNEAASRLHTQVNKQEDLSRSTGMNFRST